MQYIKSKNFTKKLREGKLKKAIRMINCNYRTNSYITKSYEKEKKYRFLNKSFLLMVENGTGIKHLPKAT